MRIKSNKPPVKDETPIIKKDKPKEINISDFIIKNEILIPKKIPKKNSELLEMIKENKLLIEKLKGKLEQKDKRIKGLLENNTKINAEKIRDKKFLIFFNNLIEKLTEVPSLKIKKIPIVNISSYGIIIESLRKKLRENYCTKDLKTQKWIPKKDKLTNQMDLFIYLKLENSLGSSNSRWAFLRGK